MISQNINQQIVEALKARSEIRLSTLRMLSSAFNYERIAKQRELTEEEELDVVRKEAKKRRDAIEIYKKANDLERLEKETRELQVLEEYLPAQMTDADLEQLVESTIHEMGVSTISDMGRVIGAVMHKSQGRVEGGRVSEVVKAKLTAVATG